MTKCHDCKRYFVTFCNLLILLMFTGCHDYTSPVGTPDVVLARLKTANIRPVTLAKALGLDRSSASLILSGKRGIPRKHFEAIAKLLGIELPELVGSLSYTNKPVRLTFPVKSPDQQLGSTPAGTTSTGAPHVTPASPRVFSDSEVAAFASQMLYDLERRERIIENARLIIAIANDIGGPNRPDQPSGGDAPHRPTGDREVRQRRTGTEHARPRKRRPGDKS